MVEATITLMRHSGLSGAGINEIIRESGAPKGSIYHYFPGGKQQIAQEALDSYSQRVLAFIDASKPRELRCTQLTACRSAPTATAPSA